jgi:hypothetical protein
MSISLGGMTNINAYPPYQVGDYLTVVNGEEIVTARVRLDEDGDLYLPHAGAITNSQVTEVGNPNYGTIFDKGWVVYFGDREV